METFPVKSFATIAWYSSPPVNPPCSLVDRLMALMPEVTTLPQPNLTLWGTSTVPEGITAEIPTKFDCRDMPPHTQGQYWFGQKLATSDRMHHLKRILAATEICVVRGGSLTDSMKPLFQMVQRSPDVVKFIQNARAQQR